MFKRFMCLHWTITTLCVLFQCQSKFVCNVLGNEICTIKGLDMKLTFFFQIPNWESVLKCMSKGK